MNPKIYKESNSKLENSRHVLNLSDINVKHNPLDSKCFILSVILTLILFLDYQSANKLQPANGRLGAKSVARENAEPSSVSGAKEAKMFDSSHSQKELTPKKSESMAQALADEGLSKRASEVNLILKNQSRILRPD